MNDQKKLFRINLLPLSLATLALSLILFLGNSLPFRLPLFYSLVWGEKQLASLQQLFIVPALIIAITLINLVIFWQLHPTQNFFRQIIIFSSLASSAVLFISFIKIILIFI